jgi:hypothetical protein
VVVERSPDHDGRKRIAAQTTTPQALPGFKARSPLAGSVSLGVLVIKERTYSIIVKQLGTDMRTKISAVKMVVDMVYLH